MNKVFLLLPLIVRISCLMSKSTKMYSKKPYMSTKGKAESNSYT